MLKPKLSCRILDCIPSRNVNHVFRVLLHRRFVYIPASGKAVSYIFGWSSPLQIGGSTIQILGIDHVISDIFILVVYQSFRFGIGNKGFCDKPMESAMFLATIPRQYHGDIAIFVSFAGKEMLSAVLERSL